MENSTVEAGGWGIHCRRCSSLLARHSQAAFFQPNDTSVHLTIKKDLLIEEAGQLYRNRHGANVAMWKVFSRDDVNPQIQFIKLRTTKAGKRAMFPFEFFCCGCQNKIGSEGYLVDDIDQSWLLLDSKTCTIVTDIAAPSTQGSGAKIRKWAAVLSELRQLKLPLEVLTLQNYLSSVSDMSEPEVTEVPPEPVVFSTEESIRKNFFSSGKLTQLRRYQIELAMSALLENTIIYLPTGCGKTLVAIKVLQEMRRLNPNRLVVFFVPTGPLVSQQAAYIRRESDFQVMELSGQHSSASGMKGTRVAEEKDLDAIVVTPDYFLNMVFGARTAITEYSVMVFDEAHHSTGNNPYRRVLEKVATVDFPYRPRILGLTASPFGEAIHTASGQETLKKIEKAFDAVVNTPTIAADDLETAFNPGDAQWVIVQQTSAEKLLRGALKSYIESFYDRIRVLIGKKVVPFEVNYNNDDIELGRFLAKLRQLQHMAERDSNNRDLVLILRHLRRIASSFLSLAVRGAGKVASSLQQLFEDLRKNSDATFALTEASYRAKLQPLLQSFPYDIHLGEEISERVRLVGDVIQNAKFGYDSRAIVFVRRRKTAIELARAMEELPILKELNPTRFIGHNSYEGMSWEQEQKPTLERFRQGRIRLLVATNVLEEGLDVPECSLVIQFDGVRGVTSLIQSRGRARQEKSTFIIFCSAPGMHRQKQIIENEQSLFLMARHNASKLLSKEIVKRLMDNDAAEVRDIVHHENGKIERNLSTLTETLEALDNMYTIVLGGAAVCSSDTQAAVLELLGQYASVRLIDQRLRLCTLEADEDDDIIKSYHSLCAQLDFCVGEAHEQQMFWMKLDYTDSERAIDIPYIKREGITIERGYMISLHDFVKAEELTGDHGSQGILELRSAMMSVSFGFWCWEFDLHALYDLLVWFDVSADDSIAVYFSFRTPPRLFQHDERICQSYQSQSYVYCVNIPASASSATDIWRMRLFFVNNGIEVRETRITKEALGQVYHSTSIKSKNFPSQHVFPFRVAYAHQSFLSACSYFTNGYLSPEFYHILLALDTNIQEKALLAFQPSPSHESIDKEFQEFIHDHWPILNDLCNSKSLLSENESVVFKVIVTPSRVIFDPPDIAPSNRVFRHFGSENFMHVYFRDENMEKLDYTYKNVLQRIRTVMEEGIVIDNVVGGGDHKTSSEKIKFRFLGSSLSQMRNNSVIFTSLDPALIRSWVGDLSKMTSPAKYLKRLGQAFSSTKEAFLIDPKVLENPKDDIEDKGYVFTDGCGEVSPEGAKGIASALQLRYIPSSFQIRVGGAKGVVVVSDIEGGDNDLETSVVLRKSMSKFASTHNMLEIIAYSGISVAYLTRQSIMILSDLGIPEEVFLEMQEDYMEELQEMIASDAGAFFQLKAVVPPNTMQWIKVLLEQLDVSIATDEYLWSMVMAIYNYRLFNTVLRARIPIAKGRALMGVADFTNTLTYGEVFVQYTNEREGDQSNTVILSDIDVVVYRSPCHHPGDIRVLRCRADVPEQLRRLRDCIVFPCSGPRPHAHECTGGDLDGDIFTVIWDKRLIPAKENIQDPMIFDEPDPSASDHFESTNEPELISFYLHSIQTDVLGVASNAHLALCDFMPEGSFYEGAKELAQICSREVDHLRTDYNLGIIRLHAPKAYPDFMQNTSKQSYQSQKVLGKMFRRCKPILDQTTLKSTGQSPAMDDHFLIAGYEAYLPQAVSIYRQYKLRLKPLLKMSGASTEAELATGMIVEPTSVHKGDYFRFGERCQDSFYHLQQLFRDQFEANFGHLPSGERRKVAAAWYQVAHTDSDRKSRRLSFPWILMDLLSVNKASHLRNIHQKLWTPIRVQSHSVTIPKLQICLLAELEIKTSELLSDHFNRLLAVSSFRSNLSSYLNLKEFDLVLYGSSALLTFEKQSDLDIMFHCAIATNRGTLKSIGQFLRKSITRSNDQVYGNISFRENTRIPVLSFSFDEWSVELCQSDSGPRKTRLFRTYMQMYPFYWPSLFFLVRWGKCVGLIRRRGGGGHNLFSPTGFMWLWLRFCIKKKFVKWINPETIDMSDILKHNNVDAEISFWTTLATNLIADSSESKVSAAEAILAFLSYYSDLLTPADSFGFTDPFDETNNTELSDDSIALFREACHIALHQLIVSHGDINGLLNHRKDQVSKVTLSRALSKRIHEAKSFFSKKILCDANAENSARLLFKMHPNSLRPDLYIAEIIGEGEAVQRVEEKLRKIEQELGAFNITRSNEMFHREGSNLLLFEGAVSEDEKIGFQEYFGERHVEHAHTGLHQAHLVCFMNGQEWYDHASARFCTRFVQQMIKLSRYENINRGLPKAKAFIRFGHHYLIHLPRSFHDETIVLASIKNLETEFERGRAARELYESVLIAKHREKAAEAKKRVKVKDDEENGNQVEDQKVSGGSNNYHRGNRNGGGKGFAGNSDSSIQNTNQKECRKPVPLRKASTVARSEKGVTHSFYSMIDEQYVCWAGEYAEKLKYMKNMGTNENYQVSMVFNSFEFNIRLTSDLQFVKITTRPSRWFNTTLKMRQELDTEHGQMDATPDVRFYVSTTEEVPKTHGLYTMLSRCCSQAANGRGILEFINEDKKDVRISPMLLEAGESPSVVTNVRFLRVTSYQCPNTELQFSLMRIREFTIPSATPEEGFLSIKNNVEAEFCMPPLTPEKKLKPSFAREFLDTGVEFVKFLRSQAEKTL